MIIFGIVLAALLLVITLMSTNYFLQVKKVKFKEWLFFNSCSPSSLTYTAGFVLLLFFKTSWLVYFGIFPMFFFGTLGLFIFPWSGVKNLLVQTNHLLMTSNIVWLVVYLFREYIFQPAVIGLLSGGFLFLVFLSFQQNYVKEHNECFKKVLGLE